MKTLLIVIIATLVLATACSSVIADKASTSSETEKLVEFTVPYKRVDLGELPYKVTKHTRSSHTEDIVIAIIWDKVVHVFRVTPRGETANKFEFDWRWDSARLLESGNYLLGEIDKRIIEVDPEGNIVWELKVPGLCHQVVPLENGNYLVGLAYYDGFAEVRWNDTGETEVMFEWYAYDHIKSYDDPANFKGLELVKTEFSLLLIPFYNTYAWRKDKGDWTHLNFAQKLPNGNYIASLRNLDLVVEVDGKSGEMVWSYGPGIIKHQHTPIVYGNYMYIFDNGNGRVIKVNRNTSRIVLIINGLMAPRFGDIRRLGNGNLLITDSFHNRAIEVDEETGKIVWEIQACSLLYRVWAEGTW